MKVVVFYMDINIYVCINGQKRNDFLSYQDFCFKLKKSKFGNKCYIFFN